VRELQNTMAALSVAAPRRGLVGPASLPETIIRITAPGAGTLEAARRAFERRFVRAAIARTGGRIGAAARELGVTRQGLAKLMTRLALDGSDAPAEDHHGDAGPSRIRLST
jgi:DNA-binding NtrC family response regulator